MVKQRLIRLVLVPLAALSLLAALTLFIGRQATPALAAEVQPDWQQMSGTMPMTGTMPMDANMTQMMGQMMQMMNQMQAMMDQGMGMMSANRPVTGTVPMRQPGMGAMMSMMGQHMQMMGMMQEMMAPCLEMVAGAPVTGTMSMTGTMPMTRAMPLGGYGSLRMMQMMGRMMQMMGMMQEMMDMGAPMMRGAMPVTGTMPMTGTMPVTGAMRMGMMDMGMMQGMLGNMHQMMNQMHQMMAPCLQMVEPTSAVTGTMPMTGTMPVDQSLMPMMGMMRQMQQMMDQMQQMMGGAPLTTIVPTTGTVASAAPVDLTQTAQAGDVTVQVTALNLDDAQAETLDFQVVLDTHAVDIDVDLAETAMLRAGDTEVAPAVWESDSPAGHHVTGVLRFPRQEIAGAEALTLTIGGLPENEEATLMWEWNR